MAIGRITAMALRPTPATTRPTATTHPTATTGGLILALASTAATSGGLITATTQGGVIISDWLPRSLVTSATREGGGAGGAQGAAGRTGRAPSYNVKRSILYVAEDC